MSIYTYAQTHYIYILLTWLKNGSRNFLPTSSVSLRRT